MEKKRRLKKGIWVGILILILFVITLAIFIILSFNNKDESSSNSDNNQVLEHYNEFVKAKKEISL